MLHRAGPSRLSSPSARTSFPLVPTRPPSGPREGRHHHPRVRQEHGRHRALPGGSSRPTAPSPRSTWPTPRSSSSTPAASSTRPSGTPSTPWWRRVASRRDGACRAVVAVGCMVERHREELEQALPEVDLFLGTSEADRLVPTLIERGWLPAAPDWSHPGRPPLRRRPASRPLSQGQRRLRSRVRVLRHSAHARTPSIVRARGCRARGAAARAAGRARDQSGGAGSWPTTGATGATATSLAELLGALVAEHDAAVVPAALSLLGGSHRPGCSAAGR